MVYFDLTKFHFQNNSVNICTSLNSERFRVVSKDQETEEVDFPC